jgi:fumarate hydratase class II
MACLLCRWAEQAIGQAFEPRGHAPNGPLETSMSGTRKEHDTFGDVEVDAAALWGAQTQRALGHFAISGERMPPELIHALAQLKAAGAHVNTALGRLDPAVGQAIEDAAAEVASGRHDAQFPLAVWQSGSGTQTNMNMNEVLACLAGRRLGRAVHPNDEVNLGQSSNDMIPSAIHVATVVALGRRLLPALARLRGTLAVLSHRWGDIVKLGRTHLQDAVPMTLGQEFGAFESQLAAVQAALLAARAPVHQLAVGGTAVGTGLNTHPEFGARVCARLATQLGMPFVTAPDRFAALSSHDGLVALHGVLRMLAVALTKIANDLRWLASGPRGGLGELRLPENEPGSSIMPGKVNPSQCEAMVMVCAQVMGNDLAVAIGGSAGHLQLNTCKPLIAHNLLQSVRLLADAMDSFEQHAVRGLQPDLPAIERHVASTLMLATALTPHIGYDRAAGIARKAHLEGTSLRQAALAMGESAEDFDRWVHPRRMVRAEAG